MRSGSQPPKHTLKALSFADALIASTPEEKKARERVEARKRRNKEQDPEEGKEGDNDDFAIRPTCDAIGRELISLVAGTLQEIGKQDVESLTRADETILLPLAQKMSKLVDRCASKQARTELVEGLGNTYGSEMSRKESKESWLTRVLYHMIFTTSHFKPNWV